LVPFKNILLMTDTQGRPKPPWGPKWNLVLGPSNSANKVDRLQLAVWSLDHSHICYKPIASLAVYIIYMYNIGYIYWPTDLSTGSFLGADFLNFGGSWSADTYTWSPSYPLILSSSAKVYKSVSVLFCSAVRGLTDRPTHQVRSAHLQLIFTPLLPTVTFLLYLATFQSKTKCISAKIKMGRSGILKMSNRG